MIIHVGRDVLLKLQDQSSSAYITVAGLRLRTITLNAGTYNVAHSERAQAWLEQLSNTGAQQVSITGAGVFRDQDADNEIRKLFFTGELRSWRIVLPDFGTVTGLFHLTSLEYGGTCNGEMTYDMALESDEAIFNSLKDKESKA